MKTPVLSPEDITQRLGKLSGWRLEGDEIRRTFEFHDFPAAIAFVNRLAPLAEQAGHHPDIDIRYNKVALALTTHDSGGLTANDFAMAEKANSVER